MAHCVSRSAACPTPRPLTPVQDGKTLADCALEWGQEELAAQLERAEDKYQAQTLIMNHPSKAGHGLNIALGLGPAELSDLLKKREQAIIDEFNAHGSVDDVANLKTSSRAPRARSPCPTMSANRSRRASTTVARWTMASSTRATRAGASMTS